MCVRKNRDDIARYFKKSQVIVILSINDVNILFYYKISYIVYIEHLLVKIVILLHTQYSLQRNVDDIYEGIE